MSDARLFWRVALPFFAGYFVSYVYRAINAVLAPTLAAEFGLTAGQLGLLSSVYFLAIALTQLPFGLLLDRYGPRRVNAALLLVAAAGGIWFALARSGSEAILARGLIGTGVSVALMASFTAFVLWYPTDRISTMNGIAFACGAVGAMTTTVPVELALRVLTWRELFVCVVGLNIAVALLLWLWVPERTAQRRGEPLAAQLRGIGALLRDPAFVRLGVCLGASQSAAVALQTLWIATWLRDVSGYSPPQVALGLLTVNVAMIVGYLGFGRAADARARGGRDALPLLLGGVAIASVCLALIVLGVRTGAMALWFGFVCFGASVSIGYSILSRRYPKEMAGRANTTVNVFGFVGMFAGQWGIGLVLDRFPQSAAGYAPEGYTWALAMVWAAQFAGLAWLWSGRALFGTAR